MEFERMEKLLGKSGAKCQKRIKKNCLQKQALILQ